MALSLETVRRLGTRCLLSNLSCNYGETMTPIFSGPHGIGKSAIVHEMAKRMNGHSIVIEASMLSEGEATGLPIKVDNADGSSEVRYVPHYVFAAIQRAEKVIFEKAKTEGFANGKFKVDNHGNTTKTVKTKDGKEETTIVGTKKSNVFAALSGELNVFKFGEELPFEDKLELIESGEIEPVIVFIDELNRTDNQTMKELMNIVLNKTVNGYKLPWWCFICSAINPCSQNSSYATNEMDNAQLDRFIKFNVDTDLEEWVDHCLNRNLNSDMVRAVASGGKSLLRDTADKSLVDQSDITPSPRSWAMIGNFMDHMERINNSRFFTSTERTYLNEDLAEIINSKVGATAGRTMLANFNNREHLVKPQEIVNGHDKVVAPAIMEKLKKQTAIQSKITADNLLKYIAETVDEFKKLNSSAKIEEKNKWQNYGKQICNYLENIPNATRMVFLKKLVSPEAGTSKNGNSIFLSIASFFAKSMIEEIQAFKKGINDIGG